MDRREIKACAGRIESATRSFLWVEAPRSHAVLHTSYEGGGEPQSGAWDGLPATVFPAADPCYRLELPGLIFGQVPAGLDLTAAPRLTVQLWEIRHGAMWHWVFPGWEPGLPLDVGGHSGGLTGEPRWRYDRVDGIVPAVMAT